MNKAVKGLALAEVAVLFAIAVAASPAAAGVATNIHGYGFYADGSPAYFDHLNITNTRTGVEWNDTYFGIGHPQIALYKNYYLIALDDPKDVQVGDVLMYHAVNGTLTNTSYATYTKLDFEHNISIPQAQAQAQAQTPTPTVTTTVSPGPSPSPTPSPSITPVPSPDVSPSPSVSPVPTASPSLTPTPTPTPTQTPPPVQKRETPGFEAAFAIIMLLISYLILKQEGGKKNE